MKYYKICYWFSLLVIILILVGCKGDERAVDIPESWPLTTDIIPADATYSSVGDIKQLQSKDGSYIEQTTEGVNYRVWTVAFKTKQSWSEVKTHFLSSLEYSYDEYSSIENHAYVVKLKDVNMFVSLSHFNDNIFYYIVRESISK